MNKFKPNYAVPPGETLKETLSFQNMDMYELKDKTALSQEILSGVITGFLPIDFKIALRLEESLGTPASFWLNLEKNYHEDLKRINHA